MPNSPSSSPGSAPCRLEWRPSAWLQAVLAGLTVLSPVAVLLCDAPPALAWPGALLALGIGLRQCLLERGRHRRQLVLIPAQPGTGLAAAGSAGSLDEVPLRSWAVSWRGPLALLDLVDVEGRSSRLVWWPDTLDEPARRELRLAAGNPGASRRPRAMAP
jgi:toxin CptA